MKKRVAVCAAIITFGLLTAQFSWSQTAAAVGAQTAAKAPPAPPQSARQALIEVIKAKDFATVQKHLPQALLERWKRLGSQFFPGNGADWNGGWLEAATAAGAKPEILEAGPVLVSMDNPLTHEKSELTVENDELAGDEDDIELGFNTYKNGEEEAHWFAPRIQLHMKLEQGVWKFMEVGFSAKLPLGDQDFLDAMTKILQKQQQQTGEMLARAALEQISSSETQYLNKYGTYSCSLVALGKALQIKMQSGENYDPVKAQADQAQRYGYAVKLSGCSGTGYSLTATPESGGGKAFCIDQGGTLLYSDDGNAESCVSAGQSLPAPRLKISPPPRK